MQRFGFKLAFHKVDKCYAEDILFYLWVAGQFITEINSVFRVAWNNYTNFRFPKNMYFSVNCIWWQTSKEIHWTFHLMNSPQVPVLNWDKLTLSSLKHDPLLSCHILCLFKSFLEPNGNNIKLRGIKKHLFQNLTSCVFILSLLLSLWLILDKTL